MRSEKLIGIMAEKKITQRQLAEEIGVNKNTVNNKLKTGGCFNTDEVIKICEVLDITDPVTKCEIFLS